MSIAPNPVDDTFFFSITDFSGVFQRFSTRHQRAFRLIVFEPTLGQLAVTFSLRLACADFLGNTQTFYQVDDSLGRLALGAIGFTQINMAVSNAQLVTRAYWIMPRF